MLIHLALIAFVASVVKTCQNVFKV